MTGRVTTSTGRVIPADGARAVGRFRPEGPLGYRSKSLPDAPIRDTREEALADEVAYWEARDAGGPVPHVYEGVTVTNPPFLSAPMRVLTSFKHNDLNGPKIIAYANGRRHTIAYDHAAGADGSHRAAVDAMLRYLDADPSDYYVLATGETTLNARIWHVWHNDSE